VDLIKNGKIQLVINTPLGETSRYDEYAIGWAALENKVSFITTLSAAATAVKAIQKKKKAGSPSRAYRSISKRALVRNVPTVNI